MCCYKSIKNLSAWDIWLIKLSAMAFILVVVKGIYLLWQWNLLVHVSIWWFVVLTIVFCLKPCLKMCKKEKVAPAESQDKTNPPEA